MKTAIMTFQKYHGRARGAIGSSIIRGEWLANHWDDAELWTNGMYSDVMIYQKAYYQYHMKDFPGIKILDICDPDWMKGDMKCGEKLTGIKEMEKYIDAVTCATDELTDTIKNFVDMPVITIPDRLDLNQFPKEVKKHEGEAKTVCWFGYMHNAEAVLNGVLPSLGERKMSLVIVSNKDYLPFSNYGVDITNIKYDINTAYDMIKDCDIVLNPRLLLANFKYKSNNKTLISWALGLPVAATLDELDTFMSAESRNKEVEKRHEEIKKDWDIKLSVEQYKQLIKDINEKRNKK